MVVTNEEIYAEIEKIIKWHYENLLVDPLGEDNEISTKELCRVLKTVYERKCQFLILVACCKVFNNSRQTQEIAINILFEWLRMAQERKKTKENQELIEENEELQRICLIYSRMDDNFIHFNLVKKVIFRKIMRLWERDSLDYFAKRFLEELEKLVVSQDEI